MKRIWEQYFPRNTPIIIKYCWEVIMEIYGGGGTTIYFRFKEGWFK